MNSKTSSMKRMATANITTDTRHKKSTSGIDLQKIQASISENTGKNYPNIANKTSGFKRTSANVSKGKTITKDLQTALSNINTKSRHTVSLNKPFLENTLATTSTVTVSAEQKENNLNLIKTLNTFTNNNQPKSSNIKVIARFRPLNSVETEFMKNGLGFVTCQLLDDRTVTINTEQTTLPPFSFDKVFDIDTSNNTMYEFFKDTIKDVCDGYNGTIFTYGQSGSGKTFTMYGDDIFDQNKRGIIPRVIDHLFDIIEESNDDVMFQLKFSILQIYKEVIYDLLTGERDLKVKESPVKGIYVEGISEFFIDSRDTFLELLKLSQDQRIVSGTKLNQYSSRSHTIFMLEVQQTLKKDNITKRGILNLIDLAGTEKVSKTGAVGETLEEAKKINLSLSALGNVIHSLTSGSEHIPYRDSKLTRMLQESLGGNYKTTLIVTCSPHSHHLEETISTLKFAQRAKTIKNKVKVNIKLSYEELQKIIAQLKIELETANKEIECLKQKLTGGVEINLKNSDSNKIDLMLESRNSALSFNSESKKPRRRAGSMLNLTKKISILDMLNDDNVIGIVSSPFMYGNYNEEVEKPQIQELKNRISELEEEVKNKDRVIKESGLDVLNSCKELYEKVLKEKTNLKANEININDFIKKANQSLSKYDKILPNDLKNIMSLQNQVEQLFNIQEFDKLKIYSDLCKAFPENGTTEHKNNFILHNMQFYLNLELLDVYNTFLQNQNEHLLQQNNTIFNLLDELLNTNMTILNEFKTARVVRKNSLGSLLGASKRNSIGGLDNKLAKLVSHKNLSILKGIPRRPTIAVEMLPQIPEHMESINRSREESALFEDNHRPIDNVLKELCSLKEFITDAYHENEKVKWTFEKVLNEYRDIIFSGGNVIKSAILRNDTILSNRNHGM
jgi:hypothetical protein